ncbi:MAG TPA: hypothetical protein VGF77_01170 [Allosphingosinicella sp.]|jgi:hypothetical protein
MSSYDAVSVIEAAIAASVVPAGIARLRVLSDSDEQVALTIVDALETAGYRIVRAEGGADSPGE